MTTPTTGVGPGHVVGRRGNDRVLGVKTDLSNVIFRDTKQHIGVKLGGAIQDATLTRTIGGASNITLDIHDPERDIIRLPLLKSRFEIELDDLVFRFKGYDKAGPDGTMRFIERNAARLQDVYGARKVYRDQMTRGEFILSEVREAPGHPIPTRFYRLHKKQLVKAVKESKAEQNETGEEHSHGAPGLGKADVGVITVKHEKATLGEIHIIDEVLQVGVAKGGDFQVLVAAIMTITQETHAQNLDSGAAGKGPFSQEPGTWGTSYPGATLNVEEDAEGFFQVAMKIHASNPGMGLGALCDAVQNPLNKGLYDAWESEAKATVERFLGGTSEVSGGGSETIFERYPFERNKEENAWKNTAELAKVVRWRRFMVAGVFFYYPETALYKSKVRAVLDEDARGVESIDGEYHENVPTTDLTITARGKYWTVPPGCVVELSKDMGPLEGRYVVESIESSLLQSDDDIEVKISKPTKPLKEPAPSTKTRTTGGSSLSPSGAPQAIEEMIAEIEATNGKFHYVWGGGHESVAALHQRLSGYDCSGYISHILWAGKLISAPATSGTLAGMYEAGEGEWLTIYANSVHVFAKIKTTSGWKWFQSGGGDNSTGWVGSGGPDSTSGYSARHPKGL